MVTLYPKDWQFLVGAIAGAGVAMAGAFVVNGLWQASLACAAAALVAAPYRHGSRRGRAS